MRPLLFCDVTQRRLRVADVSGQPIRGLILNEGPGIYFCLKSVVYRNSHDFIYGTEPFCCRVPPRHQFWYQRLHSVVHVDCGLHSLQAVLGANYPTLQTAVV